MGHVPATDGAAIMAPIAQRLSDHQIDAVSAYFATHAPTLAAPPGGGDVTAAEIMTPLERVASTPKGQLKSPYADFASVAQEGHRAYMRAGCNGCHGGGGGGGMAAPLTNPVWIYGDDDDTLFRVIVLGTGKLSPGDAFGKLGYRRKGSEATVGPMPDFGEIIKTDDDVWKMIAWMRSVHCSQRAENRC
jgi:mono/diheme cytochrome c family protein